MTDSKHTAGPWFITKGATSRYIEARLECGLIQEIAWCGSVIDGDVQANACLIAASPELLEALRLCYDHCRLSYPEVEHNNVGEAVRAAIAKATGSQP